MSHRSTSASIAQKLSAYFNANPEHLKRDGRGCTLEGTSLKLVTAKDVRHILEDAGLTHEEKMSVAEDFDMFRKIVRNPVLMPLDKKESVADEDEPNLDFVLLGANSKEWTLRACEAYVEFTDPKIYTLIHKTLKQRERISAQFVTTRLALENKATKAYFHNSIKTADVIYSPLLPFGYSELSDEERQIHAARSNKVVNTYKAPEYLLSHPNAEASLDPRLKKFFAHLFDCDVSGQGKIKPSPTFDYVIKWLYYVLFKPEARIPILILCGDSGLGKNLFISGVISGLVGPKNFTVAQDEMSRFLTVFEKGLVVLFDEFKLDKRHKATFKRIFEGLVTVEKKGKDVEEVKRIFCKAVIASNHPEDFALDMDDRKFSVCDLTNVKLKSKFEGEEFEELVEFLQTLPTNDKVLAELAQWIRKVYEQRFQDHKPSEPFKGRTYLEMCRGGLPDWFNKFLLALRSNKELSHAQLRREKITGRSYESMERHLREYDKHFNDGVPSATFKEDSHGVTILSHIYRGITLPTAANEDEV